MKRSLVIRLSSKYRAKVRRWVYDLAHFRNLLLMFVLEWKKRVGDISKLLNVSLWCSLVADRLQSNKSEWQREELRDVKEVIEKDEGLRQLVTLLKEQKEKIGNAWVCVKVIQQVVWDLKSYLRALKAYKEDPGKFNGKPGIPKPKKLKSLFRFVVPVRFEQEGRVLNFVLNYRGKNGGRENVKVLLPEGFCFQVKEVKLVYDMEWIEVQVVYEKEFNVSREGMYQAGIDLGLDNLVSVVSDNPELKSFIVSGKEIKSYHRWWNKKKAEIQSHMDRILNMMKEEKNEEKRKVLEKHYLELKKYFWNLCKARDRKLGNWVHQVTRRLADLLYETGHTTVYIGKDAIDKAGIPFSRVVNQNYVYMPHRKLVNALKYKCEELGIQVVEVGERYTSKASPVSDDVVEIQAKKANGDEVDFSGKRIKRGLYKDLVIDKVFNADLVGAMNILKVGAKLRRLVMDMKTLFIKLCNPVKFKLWDFIFDLKSNPKSLSIEAGIGASKPAFRQEALAQLGG